MFVQKRKAGNLSDRRNIWLALIFLVICLVLVTVLSGYRFILQDLQAASGGGTDKINPEELIRLHVVANSDSEEDQMLKYAVRDKILQKLAPRLAGADSLAESREIIREMEGELIYIAEQVVREWGKDYPVFFDYGRHLFPTKSYGNIVLPGGEYEAVKIKIGRAEGANWWCILFPPLCFVNVEESTTVTANSEQGAVVNTGAGQGILLEADAEKETVPEVGFEQQVETFDQQRQKPGVIPGLTYKGKKVGLFLLRFFQ